MLLLITFNRNLITSVCFALCKGSVSKSKTSTQSILFFYTDYYHYSFIKNYYIMADGHPPSIKLRNLTWRTLHRNHLRRRSNWHSLCQRGPTQSSTTSNMFLFILCIYSVFVLLVNLVIQLISHLDNQQSIFKHFTKTVSCTVSIFPTNLVTGKVSPSRPNSFLLTSATGNHGRQMASVVNRYLGNVGHMPSLLIRHSPHTAYHWLTYKKFNFPPQLYHSKLNKDIHVAR